MSVALWVASGLLAVVFGVSGSVKSTWSRDHLIASGQTGIAVYPMWLVRFTAVCELFAVVGLVVPWASGVGRVLTPVAGGGLAVVMVGAAFAHTRLREPWSVAANAVLFAAAVFVLAGRAAALS